MKKPEKTSKTKNRIESFRFRCLCWWGRVIVLDRLEQGVLQVYKPFADDPVYIQPINGTEYVRGAGLIMEMTINIHLEENTVSLKNLRFPEGYAEFEDIMLDQLMHFAEFYNLEIINEF